MPFTEPPPTMPRKGGRKVLLVDQHLAAMSDDERDNVSAWLASAASDREVAEYLTAGGYVTSAAAVRNWRLAQR